MDNRFEMMIVDDKKVRFCNGISVVSFVEREKPEILSLDLNRFMLQKSVVKYASKYPVLHFL